MKTMKDYIISGFIPLMLVSEVLVGDPFAYVANGRHNIAILDIDRNTVNSTISLIGGVPYNSLYLAVTPDGTRAYVSSSDGSMPGDTGPYRLEIVDLVAKKQIGEIATGLNETGKYGSGFGPYAIAIDPTGSLAYLTYSTVVKNSLSFGYTTLQVIDISQNIVKNSIKKSGVVFYGRAAFSPDGQTAYVLAFSRSGMSGVATIDVKTSKVTTSIFSKAYFMIPSTIAVSPTGNIAYIANHNHTIAVLDLASNTVTATIALPAPGTAIAFTPDGTKAYVTSATTDQLFVIDVATNTASNPFPASFHTPTDIVITSDRANAYVTNYGRGTLQPTSHTISVIDTESDTIIKHITTNLLLHPHAIVTP